MPSIIDSLIVKLGLDAKDFKKGIAEASKEQGKFSAQVKKDNKDQSSSYSDYSDQLQQDNRETGSSVAGLMRGYTALYAALKTVQSFYAASSSTIAKNTDLAFQSQNVGISIEKLKAWNLVAAKSGSSAEEMGQQFTMANKQVAQAKFGQLDQQGLNFLLWGGSDQNGEFKNAETLFNAKIKLIQDLFTKFKGDRTQTLYAAQQFGAGEGMVNLALQPGGAKAINEQLRDALQKMAVPEGAGDTAKEITKNTEEIKSQTDRFFTMTQPTWEKTTELLATGLKKTNDAIQRFATYRDYAIESVKELWQEEAAKQEKLQGLTPGRITGIIKQESSGNINAKNSTPGSTSEGLIGATDAWWSTWGQGDKKDPVQQVKALGKELGTLKAKYGGDEDKATQAHHEGPWGVERLGENWRSKLPAGESSEYLSKIHANMATGSNSGTNVVVHGDVILQGINNKEQFGRELSSSFSKNIQTTTDSASGVSQ